MSLPGKGRSSRWAFSVLSARGHIRPQGLDLIRLQQLAPRRHGVLALRYRSEKPLALIARELAQIGCALRIGHARTVARSAVPCIRLRAALDLFRLERVLRRCRLRKGEQRGGRQDYSCAIQSGIRAKVQTDPPGSTLPSVSLFAEVPPPSPDSTLTYCRPLSVSVIGWALIPEPVLNCHALFSVCSSIATNSPVCLPAN